MKNTQFVHSLRYQEFKEMLISTGLKIDFQKDTFIDSSKHVNSPLRFELEGILVTITAICEYDWVSVPSDVFIFEAMLPPHECIDDVGKIDNISETGVGEISLVEEGIFIRRTVLLRGGVTIGNVLHQLRLLITMCSMLKGDIDCDEVAQS